MSRLMQAVQWKYTPVIIPGMLTEEEEREVLQFLSKPIEFKPGVVYENSIEFPIYVRPGKWIKKGKRYFYKLTKEETI